MKKITEQGYADVQKAIDQAMWLEFKYRMNHEKFEVCRDAKSSLYYVVNKGGKRKSAIRPPDDYTAMTYHQIKAIRSDQNPLDHWEELAGMVSTMHGEILRFILLKKIPLEKWIRHELAARGYDENHLWVGFEKAKALWCTDE